MPGFSSPVPHRFSPVPGEKSAALLMDLSQAAGTQPEQGIVVPTEQVSFAALEKGCFSCSRLQKNKRFTA
jgi:hypothetical protein